MTNWRPFKRYFFKRSVVIIVLALVVGISLVTNSALQQRVDAEELVVDRIEQTSIQLLAPVVGMEVSELVNKLGADGFAVESQEMSIEKLADKHSIDTDRILLSVFQ